MTSAAIQEDAGTTYFVNEHSIVRTIWGKADTVLFIFAGSAAEFALNKAVDWLYFTGKLPADPLGRLFSTVSYARAIVFAKNNDALKAIDKITGIHSAVENARGAQIPDWAYRDVLFMLIDYSIRSFEILERKLTQQEKEEVFAVFYRIGDRMGLKGLPPTFNVWLTMRVQHLDQNLVNGHYTKDLFKQYRKHLGALRYFILIEVQKMIVPERVKTLLRFGNLQIIYPVLAMYKFSRHLKMDWFLKSILLPGQYKQQVKELDYTK
ncbi:DUF2236 domain-containing protein [Panacibacter sp. DH6]|uniref:DUF2236 domain-containing protein n=1 Tax=Panacibacter microcysteis TaxID=2793269 RepID=A0A931GXA6_9BACT|nr:oxygenase MpaB family protein [Panacibacter microcysteis]MBG9375299.1 DUF2236 domain-containing protein [Panacibacter microcysteis]